MVIIKSEGILDLGNVLKLPDAKNYRSAISQRGTLSKGIG